MSHLVVLVQEFHESKCLVESQHLNHQIGYSVFIPQPWVPLIISGEFVVHGASVTSAITDILAFFMSQLGDS